MDEIVSVAAAAPCWFLKTVGLNRFADGLCYSTGRLYLTGWATIIIVGFVVYAGVAGAKEANVSRSGDAASEK